MRLINNSALIVAVTKDNIIGINNQLPFHIPEDLQFFKEKTQGNIVVMGKNTFTSLNGKLLSKRANIVVSSTLPTSSDVVRKVVVPDMNAAMLKVYAKWKWDDSKKNQRRTLFYIGGAGIYEYAINKVRELYVTYVDVDINELLNLYNNNNSDSVDKSIALNADNYTLYKKYLDSKNINLSDLNLTYFPKVHLSDEGQLSDMGFEVESEGMQKDFSSIHNYKFVKYIR